jgi:tRNA threonylcarbamoyl adenosine modification protein YeaZ/ribosomal-protein-alanine acetyltransferase
MLLLALDTCLGCCSAAVFDTSSSVVIAARRELMERGQAEAIAPMVQDVTRTAGAGFESIGALVVTIGPGTFTGVRIGLALAQGLALARATPLIGLSTMLATAVPLLGTRNDVVVCHGAGGTGLVYVQHFAGDGTPQSDILLLRPDVVAVPDGAFLVGSAAGLVAVPAVRAPQHDLPDAARFVAFSSGLQQRPHADVQPIYMREAHVTVEPKPRVPPLRLSVCRVGADMAAVLAGLHRTSFAKAWPATALAEMLALPGTLALLAQSETSPAGFIMVRTIGGEAEILTLAVDPAFRKRGVATRIMESVRTHLRALHADVMFLEVASDNGAALGLYEKHRFIRVGLRKGYYPRPDGRAVDAVVMRRVW